MVEYEGKQLVIKPLPHRRRVNAFLLGMKDGHGAIRALLRSKLNQPDESGEEIEKITTLNPVRAARLIREGTAHPLDQILQDRQEYQLRRYLELTRAKQLTPEWRRFGKKYSIDIGRFMRAR